MGKTKDKIDGWDQRDYEMSLEEPQVITEVKFSTFSMQPP